MRRPICQGALIVAILGLAVAAEAGANGKAAHRREAKAAYQQASQQYKDGEFAAAAAGFLAAYDRSPQPEFLFNAAQAFRRQPDCARAAEYFERYLAEARRPPNRRDVEAKLAEMRACVAAAAGPAPVVAPPVVAPPVVAEISARARPAPILVAHPTPPAPRRRPIGLWLAGGGVVVAGVGLYFGWQARAANQRIEQFLGDGGTFDAHFAAIEARGQRDEKLAVGLVGAGGAIALAGLATYLLLPAPADDRHLAVTVDPAGAVGLAGSF